ncbi:MAG: hypothetical protein IJ007_10185 [Oscillospiraceae bacterium]|nr:hypothetical protein [Oscillospiraceae bacterium]
MKEKITEKSYDGIKVTVHIPENVSEEKRQRNINRIYDILTNHADDGDDEEKKKYA